MESSNKKVYLWDANHRNTFQNSVSQADSGCLKRRIYSSKIEEKEQWLMIGAKAYWSISWAIERWTVWGPFPLRRVFNCKEDTSCLNLLLVELQARASFHFRLTLVSSLNPEYISLNEIRFHNPLYVIWWCKRCNVWWLCWKYLPRVSSNEAWWWN